MTPCSWCKFPVSFRMVLSGFVLFREPQHRTVTLLVAPRDSSLHDWSGQLRPVVIPQLEMPIKTPPWGGTKTSREEGDGQVSTTTSVPRSKRLQKQGLYLLKVVFRGFLHLFFF